MPPRAEGADLPGRRAGAESVDVRRELELELELDLLGVAMGGEGLQLEVEALRLSDTVRCSWLRVVVGLNGVLSTTVFVDVGAREKSTRAMRNACMNKTGSSMSGHTSCFNS